MMDCKLDIRNLVVFHRIKITLRWHRIVLFFGLGFVKLQFDDRFDDEVQIRLNSTRSSTIFNITHVTFLDTNHHQEDLDDLPFQVNFKNSI